MQYQVTNNAYVRSPRTQIFREVGKAGVQRKGADGYCRALVHNAVHSGHVSDSLLSVKR